MKRKSALNLRLWRPRLPHRVKRNAVRRSGAALLALLVAALPLPAAAAPPALILPLACHSHRDCWIANHADLDPGPGFRDYACGELTYDGHKGTDFAIRDRAAMADGSRCSPLPRGGCAPAATGSPT